MTEEKLSENQKIELMNQFLSIKREKELYKFVVQLKPDVVMDLIYLLPKKKVKYACFMVFALCDYYGKIDKEDAILYFVTLLADRAKRDKKFIKQINATLAFLAQDPDKTRKFDTTEFSDEELEEKARLDEKIKRVEEERLKKPPESEGEIE